LQWTNKSSSLIIVTARGITEFMCRNISTHFECVIYWGTKAVLLRLSKVLAPEPAPAPTWALWFTGFEWKSGFFMTFRKEYWLNSLFWSDSVWIMILYTNLVWPGAGAGSLKLEPKLQYTGSGQQFRLLAAPAPEHWTKE
jgi:hypothetical protein